MIPIKDIIPPRSTPFVAIGILVLGVVVFAVSTVFGLAPRQRALDLFVNMLFLWIFADNVEDRVGHVPFAVLYAASGIAGALAQSAIRPGLAPMVITSGAVGGVIAAYFVLYPRSRVLTFFPIPLTLVEIPALFFFGLFLVLHIPDGPAALAQVAAGLACGAVMCLMFRRPVNWKS